MPDWLEIGSEPNVENIMQQIRDHLAKTDPSYRYTGAAGDDPTLPPHVALALSAARGVSGDTIVGVDFEPSSVPLLGPIIDRLRQIPHQLVVFYVNKSAKNQVAYNNQVIAALEALSLEVADHNDQRRQIEILRRKLEEAEETRAAMKAE